MERADRDMAPVPALGHSQREAGRSDVARSSQERARAFYAGVAICSLIPALFWCGVIWLAAPWMGLHPTPSGLAAIGSTIALFLTLISSVLLAGD